MKNLKKLLKSHLRTFINIITIIFITSYVYANNIEIEIKGNNFTDKNVIYSLIENKPESLDESYSNYLLKTLDKSLLFKNVSVNISDGKYLITVEEFSNINKIYFKNNERLEDEELEIISNELNIVNLNPIPIKNFIEELSKIYESFGYNNTNISYSTSIDESTNTAELYFDIKEGEITKIKNIFFKGNEIYDNQKLKSLLKSKTKTLVNIFANNNYKKFILQNDVKNILDFYKNNGYLDIKVNYRVEFLNSNKVNIYFDIFEGDLFTYKEIEIIDEQNYLSDNIYKELKKETSSFIKANNYYSLEKINELKEKISDFIINSNVDFFELKPFEKIENNMVSILFSVIPVEPKYASQINIYGNSRTYDYVIRRELDLIEGDAIYKSQIEKIRNKLQSLNLFESVKISEKNINDNLVDIEIEIEEKQTGSVNAGVSVGTLDGFAIVAGLTERNFYGTGRSVKALVNTSEDRNQYTLRTTDRLSFKNDVNVSYNTDFKQEDFSSSSSYKLDTFSLGAGISYKINPKLNHSVDLSYLIKDYSITNESTVSESIGASSGVNVSFLLSNVFLYNTLNSVFLPNDGSQIKFSNFIESPTSSSNGYVKNILTVKNFKKIDKNIFSNQTRLGNITSLNNKDILTDDKFSLGGRWLRGFDSFGAGPRNSRTSYVGGNNVVVSKFDYSRHIYGSDDFPVLLNLFNDYGLIWDNKTKPTNNDSNIRSSVGFGIKYYSPIGPIGFSWGFPIIDEAYDIKRMFLFSVGNID